MKVRSHIALLVTAILVPTVLFSAVVLNMLLTAEREAALRSMQELARASVNVMDREATFAMATAQTLATSRNLYEGKFEAFYAQAKASNQNRAIHAALLDENGQQVFNTVRPYGTRIAAPNALAKERVRKVIAGGVPVYSDLIKGSATGKYVVSVEFPVTLRDGRRVVVNEWMYTEQLTRILPTRNIPASWLISAFDKQGITIARNISPEKFVGLPPRQERLKTILAGFEGLSRAYTRDGIEMYGAWERSDITGWTVGVGVPVSEIERTAVHTVLLTAAGFIIAIVLAVGGAVLFSRRLVGAIDHASAAARSLPDYRVPPVVDLRVDEMNVLQLALHRAGNMLVAGEAVRQQSLEEARSARVHAERAQKIAEEQNRAKDEFLAMLGHELRNPLAAIASGVTMLNMPGIDGERTAKVKAIIGRQTQHLTHLVDELLDAHRILNGKITLGRTPLDLASAVEACLASFEARGAMKTHQVAAELAPAMVEADPTRLEQMIANLIDNALKYTPAGGKVTVTVRIEDEAALLEIADTGIGLTPELLERAFDVFVQGQVVNRTKGGLGIGLAVVNALAEQHGATLGAASGGLNQGSTFTLRFPLAGAAPQAADPGAAPLREGSARILVVEDNRDVREMMFLMLSEHGFAVQVAEDGQSGIAAAFAIRPDIALVDIDLPDISGYEVAASLRKSADTAGIKLVAVTGYGQAMDRDKAFGAGFDRHLAKPVPIEQLVATIDELLERTAPSA
ncbi:hybrid sensor histidine kinase/response regulator [Massilia niabensis]|uniref:histidine kinase n=1 Tax=Massilia niabensis TaxID=544910 RepID=A0ABW0L155_9BURK